MMPDKYEALAIALYYLKKYDDSNPDVGMGPTMRMLLERLCKKFDITLTRVEFDDMLREYQKIENL